MSTLRGYVTWIAGIAAVIVLWLQIPENWDLTKAIYLPPDEWPNQVLTWVFWILAILVVVLLFSDRKEPQAGAIEVEGPAFSRYLFSNTRAGLFWLPIRLFLGMSWFEAGWHKLTADTGWLDGGASLLGYWQRAVTIPDSGSPPIAYDWYRSFIDFLINGNHQGWFAYIIVFGELAVGIGLIFGILTGIAAFGGALMNMSFLLSGSGSSNPILFTAAIGIIMAWRVAGYYGVDRYLLPMLGTPGQAQVRTNMGHAGSTA